MPTKIIFANMVNQLMTETPGDNHARGLTAVSPRKLWLANEGDLVITPRLPSESFKAYVCEMLELDSAKIYTLTPKGDLLSYLAVKIQNNEHVSNYLQNYLDNNPHSQFLCFAIDRPTLAMIKSYGASVIGFDSINERTLDTIYNLNTKSGFRKIAKELGIPIVPGEHCNNVALLEDIVEKYLPASGRIIIKYDRGSNGYGHVVISDSDFKRGKFYDQLNNHFSSFSEQPKRFVIEVYLNVESIPNVTLNITNNGPEILYCCNIGCNNNSWNGMITSPMLGIAADYSYQLKCIGEIFGKYLYQAGFRGVCDLDCISTSDKKLYVTESNIRRTGGTYLENLIRRLIGSNYVEKNYRWFAEVIPIKYLSFTEIHKKLISSGLAYNKQEKKGIILTSDTLEIDNRLRYMLVTNDSNQLFTIRKKLLTLVKADTEYNF